MVQYQTGVDALNALNETGEVSEVGFASFNVGTTYTVKVLGTADMVSFYAYGIYKQINSFVAKEPSKKSAKGYPVENLTPWDKAWKYHKDLSEEFNDHHSQEAGKYRASLRFAMGFYDLDSGKPIVIDVSRNQAQAIHGAIKKYEKRLGRLAFELSKEGSGKNTTVSMAPVLDMEEDLSDKQRANFDKAPEKFDIKMLEGLAYEADEKEQVELLDKAGFDVTLIGYEKPSAESNEQATDVTHDF